MSGRPEQTAKPADDVAVAMEARERLGVSVEQADPWEEGYLVGRVEGAAAERLRLREAVNAIIRHPLNEGGLSDLVTETLEQVFDDPKPSDPDGADRAGGSE